MLPTTMVKSSFTAGVGLALGVFAAGRDAAESPSLDRLFAETGG